MLDDIAGCALSILSYISLNILENSDLQSMGCNSACYVYTPYQTMNLAYADRDFPGDDLNLGVTTRPLYCRCIGSLQ